MVHPQYMYTFLIRNGLIRVTIKEQKNASSNDLIGLSQNSLVYNAFIRKETAQNVLFRLGLSIAFRGGGGSVHLFRN